MWLQQIELVDAWTSRDFQSKQLCQRSHGAEHIHTVRKKDKISERLFRLLTKQSVKMRFGQIKHRGGRTSNTSSSSSRGGGCGSGGGGRGSLRWSAYAGRGKDLGSATSHSLTQPSIVSAGLVDAAAAGAAVVASSLHPFRPQARPPASSSAPSLLFFFSLLLRFLSFACAPV